MKTNIRRKKKRKAGTPKPIELYNSSWLVGETMPMMKNCKRCVEVDVSRKTEEIAGRRRPAQKVRKAPGKRTRPLMRAIETKSE